MKALLATLIIVLLIKSYLYVTYDWIEKRWSFDYCNTSLIDEQASQFREHNYPHPYKQIFIGCKLILHSNNSFDMVIFDNYWHGNWAFGNTKNKLLLTPENQKDTVHITIDEHNQKKLQLSIDSAEFIKIHHIKVPDYAINNSWFDNGERLIFRFDDDVESYFFDANDPYSKKNNWWRIAPTHSESDKEVKERVLCYLQFLKTVFYDASDENRAYVSSAWFISPLLPASNGIALKNYNKIKKDWETCFYNPAQAQKAFDILRSAFSKKIIYPEKVENQFRRNSIIIEQMIDGLKS